MKKHVLCGVDRENDLISLISGKSVALLTAASGVNAKGEATYTVIARHARLSLIFSPEHGLYSAMQDGKFGSENGDVHPATGARMYSLTSKGLPGFAELLRGVDLAVYDIQDVGARFYTYLCNLTQLMRAAKEAGIPVLVLDRPNPLGNRRVEGLILDESRFSSFVGEFAVPTRYGLTVGEYARYVNEEKGIHCALEVIPCEGWSPEVYADEMDLLWVNPSPNIPAVATCFNYIGSCIYEASNLSEGRGTTRPFDWLGAPFVDPEALAAEMSSYGFPGVIFRPIRFTPMFNKHAGEVCGGVELHVTDRETYEPFRVSLYMLRYLKRNPAFTLRRDGLALRIGRDVLYGDFDPERILGEESEKLSEYCANVDKYRLYR